MDSRAPSPCHQQEHITVCFLCTLGLSPSFFFHRGYKLDKCFPHAHTKENSISSHKPQNIFSHLVTELEPPPLHTPSKITPSQPVQIKVTRAECLAPSISNDALENKEPFLAYFSMLSLSPGQLESSCMNGEIISDG